MCVSTGMLRPWLLLALACSGKSAPVPDAPRARSTPSPPPTDAAPAKSCAEKRELADGLTLERVPDGPGCLTLVRIDLAKYQPVVRTARADGGPRPAPKWAADFGLVAVVNSSMFGDDGRSIGLLRDAHEVNNDHDNAKLGGFLAFDPVDPKAPRAVMTGRGCPGFDLDALRKKYRGLLQDYRMLDCDGHPIAWADEKIYSAVALALDAEGRLVLIHSRAPHKMTDLNRLIAAPELGLRAALYLEGGPEASVYVKTASDEVREIGSFETGFHDDTNTVFWDIPNVIGFVPRTL